MTNNALVTLALSLLKADTEGEVIALLKNHGYWENPAVWRDFGDTEGNYSTIGNQARYPDAALVEKIVNSVDARLTNECHLRGIDPTSDDAPRSITDAVTRFMGESRSIEQPRVTVASWDKKKRLQEARQITVAVTGATARRKGVMPSITVSDVGEGQNPADFPKTFLSLDRNNKLRIKFVQGKFNQGGTGALKFCGREGLQFLLSRRNPHILKAQNNEEPAAAKWGFTIVRRFRPSGDVGDVRNSVFKYLAPQPLGGSPQGAILSFDASSLDILPRKNDAYSRPMHGGSVIKLYEYDMKGFKGHALMKKGLMRRLEVLLPDIALPVRIHECRSLGGSRARSFANSLVGLTARLRGVNTDTIEPGFPSSSAVTVGGSTMPVRIYAFRPGRAETYRGNEGIIFTVNGQTHGHLDSRFFNRRRIRMNRLAKTLLVIVECSELPPDYREDLFMTSRDRFSGGSLWKELEEQLEDMISTHPGLRELRNRREEEAVADRIQDSKPLAKALTSVLRNSPTLSRILLEGNRLGAPHRPSGKRDKKRPTGFKGKKHPTYWRFHRKEDGHRLVREAELGRNCRIRFETDVENKYLVRAREPGRYAVTVLDGPVEHVAHNVNLHDGIANWSIALPSDVLAAGDRIVIRCLITDDTLIQPFVSECEIRMVSRRGRKPGNPGKRVQNPNSGEGNRTDKGKVALPEVIPVSKGDKNWIQYEFDEGTGCIVFDDGLPQRNQKPQYKFYVSVDNRYLRTEMKYDNNHADILKEKFICGNVLVGLAILNDVVSNSESGTNGDEEVDRFHLVAQTTRALSPILLPMINLSNALNVGAKSGRT